MEYDYHEAMKLDHQLCFPLYAAARRITGLYTPYLKPLDLTYTQYIVLLVLWEHREITVGELCRRLYLDSGTISPLIKKLESEMTEEDSETFNDIVNKYSDSGLERLGPCMRCSMKYWARKRQNKREEHRESKGENIK